MKAVTLFFIFKMRKGEMQINWVVVAVLALIFLIILALVYQDQLSKLVGFFSQMIDKVLGPAGELDVENAIKG